MCCDYISKGSTKNLLCIHDAWNFCMAAVDGDTCIKIFTFAVNSISSKKKRRRKKHSSKHIVFNSSIIAWFVVVWW